MRNFRASSNIEYRNLPCSSTRSIVVINFQNYGQLYTVEWIAEMCYFFLYIYIIDKQRSIERPTFLGGAGKVSSKSHSFEIKINNMDEDPWKKRDIF